MMLVINTVKDFLNYQLYANDKQTIVITVGVVLSVMLAFLITWILLRLLKRIVTRKLSSDEKQKFTSVFSFTKWIIYTAVFLITLDNVGVNVTAIFAASAALLVGVGLALQTFFQDIISGIFIILDRTVTVSDIIEIDGKVGRVESINLRTTKAVTIDNKVLIIPNHKFLTSTVFNWTQNGSITREAVEVGVAYGSDVVLVKNLLIEAANTTPNVLKDPEPLVLFTDFADSSLNFKLIFTVDDSFQGAVPKSDVRFKINELFKANNITIPFPQRDVNLYNQNT